MPENASPSNTATTPEPSSSGTQASASPSSIVSTGFKYGAEDAGIPDSLKGRDAREAAAYVAQLENALRQFATTNTTQQPQPQQQQMPSQTPPTFDPYDQNFASQLQSFVGQNTQQEIQRLAGPFGSGLASLARDVVARDPSREAIFRRYGSEIDAEMARVPIEMRMQKGLWEQASDLVRGRHYNELAREEAERLLAERSNAPTSEVPHGSAAYNGGATTGDKLSKMWNDNTPYVQWARTANVTEQMMRETARKLGYTPDQYADTLTKSEAIHSGAPTPTMTGSPNG